MKNQYLAKSQQLIRVIFPLGAREISLVELIRPQQRDVGFKLERGSEKEDTSFWPTSFSGNKGSGQFGSRSGWWRQSALRGGSQPKPLERDFPSHTKSSSLLHPRDSSQIHRFSIPRRSLSLSAVWGSEGWSTLRVGSVIPSSEPGSFYPRQGRRAC